MTVKEYLMLCYKSNKSQEDEVAIKEYNKALIAKYPWLEPTNKWSGKKITDCANGEEGFWPGDPDAIPEYDYEFTELDEMPDGWRIAFGDEMCERIQKELEKFDYVDEFCILQTKEKFGELRLYTGGVPVGKLSEKPVEVVYSPEMNYKWKYDEDYNEKPQYKGKDIKYAGETEQGHKFEVYDIIDKCMIYDIIDEYTDKSRETCIRCGEPAKWSTTDWISPYCDKCKEELQDNIHDRFMPIEELYMDNQEE